MTFLSSPVGAAVVGIAAAVATLAVNSVNAKDAVEATRKAFDDYAETQAKIESNVKDLHAAQEALTKAIATQGEVAQDSARKQVQAAQDVLNANKKILEQQRLTITNQLQQLRQQETPSRGGLGSNLYRNLNPFAQSTIADKRGYLEDAAQRMGLFRGPDYVDRYREYLNDVGSKRGFTSLEKEISDLISEIDAFDAAKSELEQRLTDINAQLTTEQKQEQSQLDKDFAPIRAGASSGADGVDKATESTKAYRTEAENLQKTLTSLRTSVEADNKAFADAAQALDQINELRRRYQQFGAANFETDSGAISIGELKKLNEQTAQQDAAAFEEVNRRLTASAVERSRVAVRALLDYAQATNDVAATLNQLPSFADILTGEDKELVRSKLSEMAKAAADAVATGLDKIQIEFTATVAAIERARSGAIAAGIADMGQFDRALTAAMDDFAQKRQEFIDAQFPAGGLDSVVASIAAGSPLPETPEFVDGFESIRDGVREGMKAGLREGIQTDDWGQALRNAVAEAVTRGFDEAINVFADALTDILTGRNQTANALFSSVAGIFGFGGARASGGPVAGGKTYLVGERGPELVTMGGTGQVLNAALTNRLLSPGNKGGPTVVNANLVVQGSIDAVTWPKVEAAMKANSQKLLSMMPGVVNATLIDNRIHKRRL
jgi:hypothetical protein